jgi:hypothetical protein
MRNWKEPVYIPENLVNHTDQQPSSLLISLFTDSLNNQKYQLTMVGRCCTLTLALVLEASGQGPESLIPKQSMVRVNWHLEVASNAL